MDPNPWIPSVVLTEEQLREFRAEYERFRGEYERHVLTTPGVAEGADDVYQMIEERKRTAGD